MSEQFAIGEDADHLLLLGGFNYSAGQVVNISSLQQIFNHSIPIEYKTTPIVPYTIFDLKSAASSQIPGQRKISIADTIEVNGRVCVYYSDDQMSTFSVGNHNWAQSVGSSAEIKRLQCSLVKVDDGRVMVVGGLTNEAAHICEIYDIASNTWSQTAPFHDARIQEIPIQLKSGSVMVIGGSRPLLRSGSDFLLPTTDFLKSCEIFDLGSGNWTPTGDLLRPPAYAALLLEGGDVLAAAGDGISFERFHPSTGVWRDTGSFNVVRGNFKLIKLRNGKILAMGGQSIERETLSSCEVYDPVSECWTVTGSLIVPRESFTANLLPNGKVVVIGGTTGTLDAGKSIGSAEIYDPDEGTWKAVER